MSGIVGIVESAYNKSERLPVLPPEIWQKIGDHYTDAYENDPAYMMYKARMSGNLVLLAGKTTPVYYRERMFYHLVRHNYDDVCHVLRDSLAESPMAAMAFCRVFNSHFNPAGNNMQNGMHMFEIILANITGFYWRRCLELPGEVAKFSKNIEEYKRFINRR